MKLSLALCGVLLAGTSAFQVQPTFRAFSRSLASAPLAAVVNTNEHADRDIGTLDQWATASGAQKADGFQLSSEDGIDFSVMTTQPLQQGSPVLFVPNNMVLSANGARQELGGYVEAAVDQLGRFGAGAEIPEFCLFVKVLMEYEKGDQSPWFPWLNSLPRLFYNAVSMTDFCYECLPPLVFRLAKTERVKFDNFVSALQTVEFLSEETKSESSVMKWAFNVVHTRSWEMDGDRKLAPMADMFNHGTETEIAMSYDGDGNCNVYTTKDVPAGSPLRMSYGDPTNPSHLFATYGFLDETAPATFCKIMNIQPTPQLRDIGFDFSRMLFYKDSGEISEEVWDVMLYQVLGASNREYQQAFYNAHMNGDVDTKRSMHQHYFLETSTALKEHVDTFLEQLDELSAKGVGKDINQHPRLPLILRHNEFVKSTFLTVKARLDPMVAQAQAAQEPVYS